MHYKDLDVELFVNHWYKKDTYLNAYSMYIQPTTNMKMWPKSSKSVIEPPEITVLPRRPRKNRRKDKDEPTKKKFGKPTRKGRKIKCSLCKNFGHKKKGCPSNKNGSTTETSTARNAGTTASGAGTSNVASARAAGAGVAGAEKHETTSAGAATIGAGNAGAETSNVENMSQPNSQQSSTSVCGLKGRVTQPKEVGKIIWRKW